MTRHLCAIVAIGMWLEQCAEVSAQEAQAKPTEEITATVQPPRPAPVLLPAEPVRLPNESEEAYFSAHLLLGMQTGARIEVALLRKDKLSVVGEAFYGALLTRIGSAEGAGAGARALFRRASTDGRNSLILGPGLDVLAQFENHSLVMVAPSVDLSWLRALDYGAGWETGINIGVGVGVSSTKEEDKHVGGITPLISFYTGLRY